MPRELFKTLNLSLKRGSLEDLGKERSAVVTTAVHNVALLPVDGQTLRDINKFLGGSSERVVLRGSFKPSVDVYEPKRFDVYLPRVAGATVYLTIDDYVVRKVPLFPSVEVSSSLSSFPWVGRTEGYSWSPASTTFSEFAFYLVVEGSHPSFLSVNLRVRSIVLYGSMDLRVVLAHTSLPLESGDGWVARGMYGSLAYGSVNNILVTKRSPSDCTLPTSFLTNLSYPPLSRPLRSVPLPWIEDIDPVDDVMTIPLNLPGVPSAVNIFLQVDSTTSELTELEEAICAGDLERVIAIVKAAQAQLTLE
jgi:hypothetical protein